MKIIALDSSGLVASVAIWEDDCLVAEYTVNYKKTHSQTLLPMLDELKKMTDLDLNSVAAIAVAAGPGSFTGLRIGSATAKGLGLALNIPIISVPTVDALAFNYYGANEKDIICPIMDARREQVYSGIYQFRALDNTEDQQGIRRPMESQLEVKMQASALMISELIEKLNQMCTDGRVIFLGDGVPVYQQIIMEQMKVPYSFAPSGLNRQRAACIAHLGSLYFKEGKLEQAAEHSPIYLRLSQAERERMEQENKSAT